LVTLTTVAVACSAKYPVITPVTLDGKIVVTTPTPHGNVLLQMWGKIEKTRQNNRDEYLIHLTIQNIGLVPAKFDEIRASFHPHVGETGITNIKITHPEELCWTLKTNEGTSLDFTSVDAPENDHLLFSLVILWDGVEIVDKTTTDLMNPARCLCRDGVVIKRSYMAKH